METPQNGTSRSTETFPLGGRSVGTNTDVVGSVETPQNSGNILTGPSIGQGICRPTERRKRWTIPWPIRLASIPLDQRKQSESELRCSGSRDPDGSIASSMGDLTDERTPLRIGPTGIPRYPSSGTFDVTVRGTYGQAKTNPTTVTVAVEIRLICQLGSVPLPKRKSTGRPGGVITRSTTGITT
mgnify:CR=1 FL=1